jgi:hypothetical protein
LPAAHVANIKTGDDRISFDVDRTGVPILVKTSYFPNWRASGAGEVYRVMPNLMVVVPTKKHVSLHYGDTPVDMLGFTLTVLGIAAAVTLARRPAVTYPEPPPPPVDDEDDQEPADDDEREPTFVPAYFAPVYSEPPPP